MKKKTLQDIGLLLMAVVFSIGLMFAFIELPKLLDQLLQATLNTPHSDPGYNAYKIELFYEGYAIRLIGYLCLGAVVLMIVLGFSTRRTGLAWLGGVALFLPVLATFAYSMFYLAGLGIFNIILFPFLDLNLVLVDLGKVVLVPYWILLWFFDLFHWDAHSALVYFFMGSGAMIFVLGVFSWFRTRYNKSKVARHWLYKYSRHPQYLGWIIWSYGLMLYGPTVNDMKKSWGWHGTLPWLLSVMVIIGICMLEEMKMKERAGEEYEAYRDNTPFLFPLPKFISWIFDAPMRLLFKKKRPGRRWEVGAIITIYTVLLTGLSLIWVKFPVQADLAVTSQAVYSQARVDSLLHEIQKPQSRRDRSMRPYNELCAMGSQAYPIVIELIGHEEAEVREFAIEAAAQNKIQEAVPAVITALHDSIDRNKRCAIRALGHMQITDAIDTLMYFLEHNIEGYRQDVLLNSLAHLGCKEIILYLEKNLENTEWYVWAGNIRSMIKLDLTLALSHIYEGLESTDPLIRREAVYIILEYLPDDAIPHLEKVKNDQQWEIRFYARQAIRLINEK